MDIAHIKRRLRRHRWLYALTGCYYPALPWKHHVNRQLDALGEDALVLDLGSGNHRRRPHVINLDITPSPQVDILADGGALPFLDESLDMVISEAVLEHVKEPEQIVAEIGRVLRPGGVVCVAVPFIQGFHASPHDYQRYTLYGLEQLMRRFERQASGPCAGPMIAFHWIAREWVGLLGSFGNLLLAKVLSLLFGWLTYPLVWLDPLLLRHPHAHILASAVYFVGTKPRTAPFGVESHK